MTAQTYTEWKNLKSCKDQFSPKYSKFISMWLMGFEKHYAKTLRGGKVEKRWKRSEGVDSNKARSRLLGKQALQKV